MTDYSQSSINVSIILLTRHSYGQHNPEWHSCGQHHTMWHSCGQHHTMWQSCVQHHTEWLACGQHHSKWHSCGQHHTMWHSCGQHCSKWQFCRPDFLHRSSLNNYNGRARGLFSVRDSIPPHLTSASQVTAQRPKRRFLMLYRKTHPKSVAPFVDFSVLVSFSVIVIVNSKCLQRQQRRRRGN